MNIMTPKACAMAGESLPADAARNGIPIQKHDLVLCSDAPRIGDLTLARRLAFEKPYNIRKLIERNKAELEAYGALPVNSLHAGEKPMRGRPGLAYLLNEGQALVLCALSRTPVAASVRQELVRIFLLYRSEYPPLPPEVQALRDLCELSHVFRNGRRRFLLAPVTTAILDALAAFDAGTENDEDGADMEPSLGGEETDLEGSDDDLEGDGNTDKEPSAGWTGFEDQSVLQAYGGHDEEEPTLGFTEAEARGDHHRKGTSDLEVDPDDDDELDPDSSEWGVADQEGIWEQFGQSTPV
ncbi:hypothetical protein V5F77_20430 [Xanthobacter sp. DSM 24535]|uniref:hypothetical protein n=1 Tax=Roseixanthobacter psychrophilus TaxID=3119917 RepID=UPI003726614F